MRTYVAVRAVIRKVGQRMLDQPAGRAEVKRVLEEHVIPVSAIEAANRESLWLKEGESIQQYPLFQADRYPLAPQDWLPPFPYKPGTVHWSQ